LTRRERKGNRVGTIVFAAIVAVVFIMIFALPQFYISNINITGMRVITKEQIIALGNVKTGNHIFLGVNGNIKDFFQLRHRALEKVLLANLPYLKNIQIKSIFPSVLQLELEERVEVAYIAISDGCVVIDSEGIVLEVLGKSDLRGIPIIEGISANQVQLGKKASVDLPGAMTQAVVLLNDVINADKDSRVDVKLLSCIKTIRPIQEGLLYITIQLPVTGEDFIVKIKNSSDNVENLVWLRFALSQRKLDGKGKGILDLTSTQRVFIPENQ